MLRTFLITLLLYANTLTAFAQTTDPSAQTTSTPALSRSVSDWPRATQSPYFDHSLAIIALANPSKRQSCDVQEITSDSIICRAKHHKQTTYRRDEIAAIIDPPYHGDRDAVLIFMGCAAIALAGSFFVPLAASIVLRVVTGILLWSLAWDENPSDHAHDILLYQRPNTALTIHLHT